MEKAEKQWDVINKIANIDTFFKKSNMKTENFEMNPDVIIK
jgi:predicted RNase H-like nuclease